MPCAKGLITLLLLCWQTPHACTPACNTSNTPTPLAPPLKTKTHTTTHTCQVLEPRAGEQRVHGVAKLVEERLHLAVGHVGLGRQAAHQRHHGHLRGGAHGCMGVGAAAAGGGVCGGEGQQLEWATGDTSQSTASRELQLGSSTLLPLRLLTCHTEAVVAGASINTTIWALLCSITIKLLLFRHHLWALFTW